MAVIEAVDGLIVPEDIGPDSLIAKGLFEGGQSAMHEVRDGRVKTDNQWHVRTTALGVLSLDQPHLANALVIRQSAHEGRPYPRLSGGARLLVVNAFAQFEEDGSTINHLAVTEGLYLASLVEDRGHYRIGGLNAFYDTSIPIELRPIDAVSSKL